MTAPVPAPDRDRETVPDLVTPISTGGEKVEPLVMPPDIRERLQERLDAIARAERQAAIDAHRVIIR